MKRFLGVALLMLITSYLWRDVVVFGVFKVQQDFISRYQCVNRNKPITQCNGNCVLTERLAQPLSESQSNESTPILGQIKMEFLFDYVPVIKVFHTIIRIFSGYLNNPELDGYLESLIKPPEFA